MQQGKRKSLTVLYWQCLFLLSFLTTLAQEMPPITHYSSDQYGAGNQNWAITQAENDFIYIANNDGLLEFNGSSWRLFPSPNNAIVRAVSAIDGKVFTGSYMDFGVWERDPRGKMMYRSMLDQLRLEIIEDEQFWNIIQKDKWILFQSFNRIIIYDTQRETATTIDAEFSILKMFEINGAVFYQDSKFGLYAIENGQKKLISNADALKDGVVINMFDDNDGLLIVTQANAPAADFHHKNPTHKETLLKFLALVAILVGYFIYMSMKYDASTGFGLAIL